MKAAMPDETGIQDAVVIGSGPNGLAAAIVLARAGRRVIVYEAQNVLGGGSRSAPLTFPDFVHDICSAVHPFAAGSPFFRELPLGEYGLQWIHPGAPLAHPFDGGTAAMLERSVADTALTLGSDRSAYERLMQPLVDNWARLEWAIFGRTAFPPHPLAQARFGLLAALPAEGVARAFFEHRRARALFAGLAAHSMLPLGKMLTAGFGLGLALAGHVVGWPIPRGGAQAIPDALVGYLKFLGGEVAASRHVTSIEEFPRAQAVLCNVSPAALLKLAGQRFPLSYRRKLARFHYGPAAFKVDWALGGPIPWKAPECARAGTVHLGGEMEEIAASEQAVWKGHISERPFVLLTQPTLFDSTRAPEGKHIAWAYCHVPNGSNVNMLERIEGQIERFAPGFRDRILARAITTPADIERHNANCVGGDIGGGAADIRQFFARPTARLYETPDKHIYICSSSTPPGPGVHGMCGYFAAQAALKRAFK